MPRGHKKTVLPSLIHFRDSASCVHDKAAVIGVYDHQGQQIGDFLDDNNGRAEDFYRYHDVYHYAKDQILRYSPVLQSLKGYKRNPRDLKADECSVLTMHTMLSTQSRDMVEDIFHETHRWIWGHKAKSQRADFDVYRATMLNAFDVFNQMVDIKKQHPEPIDIAVGFHHYNHRIQVMGVKPL